MTARRPRGAPPGSAHPRARFTDRDIDRIHELGSKGWTHREIAKLLEEEQDRPCRADTIGKILRGERYARA